MKIMFLLVLITAGCFCFLMSGCGKGSNLNPFQKWHIISDSSTAYINGVNSSSNYVGKPDDYFDFRLTSILYIKEDSLYDTIPFLLYSNTQIILRGIGLMHNDEMADFKVTSTTIDMSYHSSDSSGNWYKRIVHLQL